MLDDDLNHSMKEVEASEAARKQQWANLLRKPTTTTATTTATARLTGSSSGGGGGGGGSVGSTPGHSEPNTPKKPVQPPSTHTTLPASVTASLLELHGESDYDSDSATAFGTGGIKSVGGGGNAVTGAGGGGASSHHNSNLIAATKTNPRGNTSNRASPQPSPQPSPQRTVSHHNRNSSHSSSQPALVPTVGGGGGGGGTPPIHATAKLSAPNRLTSPQSTAPTHISVATAISHTASVHSDSPTAAGGESPHSLNSQSSLTTHQSKPGSFPSSSPVADGPTTTTASGKPLSVAPRNHNYQHSNNSAAAAGGYDGLTRSHSDSQERAPLQHQSSNGSASGVGFFAGGIGAVVNSSSVFVFSPLFSDLRGLSVEQQISHARHLISDIQSYASVTEALDEAVRKVVKSADQARIDSLKKQCADKARDTKAIKEKWATDSVSFDHAVPPLTAHIESLTVANAHAQRQLDDIAASIKSLEADEQAVIEKLKRQSDIRDLAAINRRCLRHFARYIMASDLASLCRVCVRWNTAFDRGQFWRVVVIRTARRIERESQRGRGDQKPVVIPPHVSVVLDNATISKKDKQSNNADVKAKIFDKCIAIKSNEALAAQSETEDALSKTATERQVKLFMSGQVSEARQRIGEARLEQYAWDKKMSQVQTEKSHIAKEISRLEKEITDSERDKQTAEHNYRLALKQYTERIQALKDIAQYTTPAMGMGDAMGGGGSGGGGGAPVLSEADRMALDAKVEQLKRDKKVLIKGVKKLREELADATRARDSYQSTIDTIRAKMDGGSAAAKQ